jgi:hypothetical protein
MSAPRRAARPAALAPVLALLGLAACGPGLARRPLVVELEGLSARADTLVVKMFPESTGQTCQGVSVRTAPSLGAPHFAQWTRGGGERRLELPEIDDERLTLIAYGLRTGEAIQFACREVSFSDIGELDIGVLVLTLSRRVD